MEKGLGKNLQLSFISLQLQLDPFTTFGSQFQQDIYFTDKIQYKG